MVVIGLLVFGVSALVYGHETRISGVVAAVTSNSLDVLTSSEGMKSVGLDSGTGYSKWLMYKPLQASQQADFDSIGVGSCVQIALRGPDLTVARLVHVSFEPIGSIYDPCVGFRK
jgi:hypothetical protein